MAIKRQRLAAQRRKVGYSQEALAAGLGVDRTTVIRWETTDTEPQPWLRPKLARVLGVTTDELHELLADVEEVASSTDASRLLFALRSPSQVDSATIAGLGDQLAAIGQRYEHTPSAALLAEAGELHAQVALLLSNVGTDQLRRELFALQATSATCLGQLVWDASGRRDHLSTRAYYDQAVSAAQETGDVVAEGHARLRSSFVHLYGRPVVRDPVAGRDLAETAVASADGTSHALAGLAWLHVGEAHAMTSEYRLCEKALAQAEQHFNNFSADDPGAELFSSSQFGRLSGSCYLFLGSPERAEPILQATVAQLGDRQKSRSLVLGNLALSFIRQRKLDEATATLHNAIDILEQSRGAAGLTIAFGAGRELYPWRAEPAVQDVTDRLLSLMAVS
ncbi:MAG: helix-turn-helix transcriptional regulator [Micromonosporaceae bacterium]